MQNRYTENLLGAVALGLADAMAREAALCAGDGAAVPAALVSIGAAPGQSIGMLAHTLALSHSATVRVVAGLVRRRLVIRRPGMDMRTAALYLSPRGLARRPCSQHLQPGQRLPPRIHQRGEQTAGRDRWFLPGLHRPSCP